MKMSSKSGSVLLELQNIRLELVFLIHLFPNAFCCPYYFYIFFVCFLSYINAYQVSSVDMIIFWSLFWFPGCMVWFQWREARWWF
jgi:hypothetical protein